MTRLPAFGVHAGKLLFVLLLLCPTRPIDKTVTLFD